MISLTFVFLFLQNAMKTKSIDINEAEKDFLGTKNEKQKPK